MQYNYKGKKITLDDNLVREYKKIWLDLEPNDVLFDGYLSSELRSDDIDSTIKRMSNSYVSSIIGVLGINLGNRTCFPG